MAIRLEVQPMQSPMKWVDFLGRGTGVYGVSEDTSRFGIALDGYVHGGPRFEPSWPCANFNHHEEVDRLATRATCGQVLMALRQGLFKAFRRDNEPEARVFVNDCDEDVCTSWYLIKNHAVCEQAMNPLINRLVMMEDHLDATAGAYPFPPDLPVLGELAWVFEPYRQFRLSGQLAKRDKRGFQFVIESVEHRIGKHVMGHGQSIPLDTSFKRIGGGEDWSLVEETGAQARTGMFASGIQAFVSVRESVMTGRYDYVVGRMSPFIPFNCERIYKTCNAVEGLLETDDRWGGSNTIGGSPRNRGSKIDPDTMIKLVSQALK